MAAQAPAGGGAHGAAAAAVGPPQAPGAGQVLSVVNLNVHLERPTLTEVSVEAFAEFRSAYNAYLAHCAGRHLPPDPVRECFSDTVIARFVLRELRRARDALGYPPYNVTVPADPTLDNVTLGLCDALFCFARLSATTPDERLATWNKALDKARAAVSKADGAEASLMAAAVAVERELTARGYDSVADLGLNP